MPRCGTGTLSLADARIPSQGRLASSAHPVFLPTVSQTLTATETALATTSGQLGEAEKQKAALLKDVQVGGGGPGKVQELVWVVKIRRGHT